MQVPFNIQGDYFTNTKVLDTWHQKQQKQLLLNSVWISLSFVFISYTIVQNYQHAGGTHTEWLVTVLAIVLLLSLFEQIAFWRWQEGRRTYTHSILKDLLLSCKRSTMLRLILFVIYFLTYLLLLATAFLFYRDVSQPAAIKLLANTTPLSILMCALCTYYAYQCKQQLLRFNQLLMKVPSSEN